MDVYIPKNKLKFFLGILRSYGVYRSSDIESIESQLLDEGTILFPGPLDEVNFEIMHMLEDKELFSACRINKRTAELCRNEQFWRNRIVRKFGADIKGYLPGGKTYKYIYRVLSTPYNNRYYVAVAFGLLPLVQLWHSTRFEILKSYKDFVTNVKAKNLFRYWKLNPEEYIKKHYISSTIKAIYNNYLDVIKEHFAGLSKSSINLVLINGVDFCYLIKRGYLEMLDFLLDTLIKKNPQLHIMEYGKESPGSPCYKFLYIYENEDPELIHRILTKSYVSRFIKTKTLVNLLLEVQDYEYIGELSSKYPELKAEFEKVV